MRNYRRKCIGSDRYNERRSDRVAAVWNLSLHVLRAVAACNLILIAVPIPAASEARNTAKGEIPLIVSCLRSALATCLLGQVIGR
jgi:prephenate dehydrogenase